MSTTPPNRHEQSSGQTWSRGSGDDGSAPRSAGPPAGADPDSTRVNPVQPAAQEQPTVAVPVSSDWNRENPRPARQAEPVPGTYWHGEAPAQPAPPPEPAIFPEGAFPEPASRAGAHLWGTLIALVFSPVAWFLINDGSARVYWSLRADVTGVNIAGLIGLGAGLLVALIVLLAARWSSVGAAIAGTIGLLAGAAFLVVPVDAFDVLAGWESPLRQFGGLGENVFAYLEESALRGQFLVAGFILVMVAVVSHGARRKGRREEYARIAVRAARGENPFT